MLSSIEWSSVADLYDNYVQSTLDIPFFLDHAQKAPGEVLELMSGTGRVSLPLIEKGVRLTCVDASPEMLTILRTKLDKRSLAATIHQMDVRELDLGKQFDLIFVPFHSFAELLTLPDQCKTLAAIHRHLSDAGQFICTLHNPRVRLKSVDGQLRLWGKYPLLDRLGTLLFWGLENYDSESHIVNGLEFFEEYGSNGVMQTKKAIELHFRIVTRSEFETWTSSLGFRVAALYGDYASKFCEDSSPFMIWVLRKA